MKYIYFSPIQSVFYTLLSQANRAVTSIYSCYNLAVHVIIIMSSCEIDQPTNFTSSGVGSIGSLVTRIINISCYLHAATCGYRNIMHIVKLGIMFSSEISLI